MEHHGTMDENNEDEMETGDALGFFLESDLLHFFHHYATKKFEQMAVLKRQMVDDLVSILLGFPKGRCHDDVATMSKATRMVSLQSLCTLRDGHGNGYDVLPSVVPNHSMPGAKKAFFMCDLSAAGDVSK